MRRDLLRGAAREQALGQAGIANEPRTHFADGAGNRLHRPGKQCVAGAGREILVHAGREFQSCRMFGERLQHEPKSRQDDAAAEHALGVERVNGHRRSRMTTTTRGAKSSIPSARLRAATSAAHRSARVARRQNSR